MARVSVTKARKEAGRAERAARKTVADARRKNEQTAARFADKMSSDSFLNFALSLGIGTDNGLSASTYGFNPITRQRIILEWIHRGSWLGGMAVDVVADDMTRAGVELQGELAPDDIEKIEEHISGLGVWESINDNIKWSRLYGGSIAVILIEGQKYNTPLRIETVGKNQFRGLAVFDRWMVEPSLGNLVTDPGPSLGLPKFYRVSTDSYALPGETVHYSRCIRLEGIRLPYYQRLMENLWGLSVIERLYDRMVAFDASTQGAAQLVQKSFLRTLKLNKLREALVAGGKAEQGVIKMVSMMRRSQQNEGITLIDKEDEFQLDQSSGYAGIAEMILRFGEQLSGALQIPLVRLFGQSPAGLSATGESDLRNYYDGIKQLQRRQLRLDVTKVYRAGAQSIGVKIPPGFGIDFRSLWQMTEKERAETAQTIAQAIDTAVGGGLIKKSTGMRELKQSSNTTGVFSNIEDEDIEEAREEEKLAPPPGPEQLENAASAAGPGGAAAKAAEKAESDPGAAPSRSEGENVGGKPPNLPPGKETAPEGKKAGDAKVHDIAKSSVDYSKGKPSAHCGICKHFIPEHACRLVDGRIDPEMWCRLFEQATRDAPNECFCCGRPLGRTPPKEVWTSDPQMQRVSPDCYAKIAQAGAKGYQPPLGGPRLYATEVQGRAANKRGDAAYPHFHGLDVVIETRKGETRAPWGSIMPADYGYIRKTGSEEGLSEQMDCFVGPNAKSAKVWIVHQRNLDTKAYDEAKVMLGFDSAAQAIDCYTESFHDGKGRDRIMSVDEVSYDALKDWLKSYPYSLDEVKK